MRSRRSQQAEACCDKLSEELELLRSKTKLECYRAVEAEWC